MNQLEFDFGTPPPSVLKKAVGWAAPGNAAQYHLFLESVSLCGKWKFAGETFPFKPGDHANKYLDCLECWAKASEMV